MVKFRALLYSAAREAMFPKRRDIAVVASAACGFDNVGDFVDTNGLDFVQEMVTDVRIR